MSLKTAIRYMIAIGSIAALPLYAQTTTTSESKTTEKKTTKTTKTSTKSMKSGGAVFNDATRLAAILQDTQGKASINDAAWKTIANESNALAHRLHSHAKGSLKSPAASAAKHVSEMRSAALKGDAAGAKTHAAEALPYLYKIIDASAPAPMTNSHM